MESDGTVNADKFETSFCNEIPLKIHCFLEILKHYDCDNWYQTPLTAGGSRQLLQQRVRPAPRWLAWQRCASRGPPFLP